MEIMGKNARLSLVASPGVSIFHLKDDSVTSKDSKASFQSIEKESLHFWRPWIYLDMAWYGRPKCLRQEFVYDSIWRPMTSPSIFTTQPGPWPCWVRSERWVVCFVALHSPVVQVCFPLEPAWWRQRLPKAGEQPWYIQALSAHASLCHCDYAFLFQTIHSEFSIENCWGSNMVYQQGAILDALHVEYIK